MPIMALLDKPEAELSAFKNKVIILGVSINNTALEGEYLKSALELFKKLQLKKVILLLGSELLRHNLAAEGKLIHQVREVDDPVLIKRAFRIEIQWRENPDHRQIIEHFRASGLGIEVESWCNFSPEEDFASFVKQLKQKYEQEPILQKSIKNVALVYLLKHTNYKKKVLHEVFSSILSLAPNFNNQEYELSNIYIGLSNLYSWMNSFTGINPQQELNAIQYVPVSRTYEQLIQIIIDDLIFLYKYLNVPLSLQINKGEIKYSSLEMRALMPIIQHWQFWMKFYANFQAKSFLTQKIKDNFPLLENELNEILEASGPYKKAEIDVGQAQDIQFAVKKEKKLIAQEERQSLRKWRNANPSKAVLEGFALLKNIDQRMTNISEEIFLSLVNKEQINQFMQRYIPKSLVKSFLHFLENHVSESNRKSIINAILGGTKSESEGSDLNKYLLQVIFEESFSTQLFDMLNYIFNRKEELLSFLLKLLSCSLEKRAVLAKVLVQCAAYSPGSTSIDIILETIRGRVQAILRNPENDVKARFILLETAFQENLLYIIRVYLNSLILEEKEIKELLYDSLPFAAYKYLNNLFAQKRIVLEGENVDIREEVFNELCKDEFFSILFKGSVEYILEECGGIPYIANKVGAHYFAYPKRILDGLIHARNMTFIANGEEICLAEKKLMECITYSFESKEEREEKVTGSNLISDRTQHFSGRHSFFYHKVDEVSTSRKTSMTPMESTQIQAAEENASAQTITADKDLIQLLEVFPFLSQAEKESAREKLIACHQSLIQRQYEKIQDISHCQKMLSLVSGALLNINVKKVQEGENAGSSVFVPTKH